MYGTADGIELYRQELEVLEVRLRKKGRGLGEAAADGNTWHDNASYESLRDEVSIDATMLNEKRQLISGAIAQEYPGEARSVAYGTRVVFQRDGKRKDFKFVGLGHVNPDANQFSYESPIAQALMGREPGDEFEAQIGKRTSQIRILEVHALTDNDIELPSGEGD